MMLTFKHIKYEKFTQRHGICKHFFLDNSHGLSNIVEIHAEIQPKDFFFFFGKRCKLVNKTDCGPYSHFVTP